MYERPGVSITEVAARLSMTWGQINYHLIRLTHAGLVTTVKAGRHRLVFPSDHSPEMPEDRAILLGKTARAIALVIVENPYVAITDLVRISGESERVVYYHVRRLLDAGLVSSASGSHLRGLTASARLVRLLGDMAG